MKRIACLMAEGFEELELVAVCDILRRAEVTVDLVGQKNLENTSAHGFRMTADVLLADYDFSKAHGIYIPGGSKGAENLKGDERVLEIIRNFNDEGKLLAAICAGPTVLNAAGILDQIHVTSYPSLEDEFGESIYIDNAVSVQEGHILTSRGPATAPYLGFDILYYLDMDEEAEKIYDEMLFDIVSFDMDEDYEEDYDDEDEEDYEDEDEDR